MRIGYFGGSFDPIHLGHLAAARAALEQLGLNQILFVPTDVPPHKRTRRLTPFIHRYAMIALASSEAGETQFTPSLLEAPREGKQRPRYSIETIRALKSELKRSDELFFLIGIDAFVDIAKWHKSEELLRECEFVVVSRPGFSLSQVADALPAALRPRTIISRGPRGTVRTLRTKGATIHLLEGVSVPISATELRADLRKRRVAPHASFWRKLLPESVADYIQKLHLYEVE